MGGEVFDDGKKDFEVHQPHPYQVTPVNVDAYIQSVSAPVGWRMSQQATAKPGENVFQVHDGVTFAQPNDSSAQIHVGPSSDSNRFSEEAMDEFRKLSLEKSKPHQLTAAEIKAVDGMLPAFHGRNNQYAPGADNGPQFEITNASTVDINGKTGLMIEAHLQGATNSTESIYMDNSRGGIEQVTLTAPQSTINQYDQQLLDTAKSIKWK